MSDTYISDKVNVFRGDAKSESRNQWYSGSWLDREREALSISVIPGKKVSRQMFRLHQAELTPMEQFKQSIIRLIDKGAIEIREADFLDITERLSNVEDLQYRNVLAIVLSYQICNSRNEGDVKKLFAKGEENDVPVFDTVRYIRYWTEFGLTPTVPIKVSLKKESGKK